MSSRLAQLTKLMTPDRKLDLIKLGCCVAMFSAIAVVEGTHSDVVAAIGIGTVILSLYTLHLTVQWERQFLEVEQQAMLQRLAALCQERGSLERDLESVCQTTQQTPAEALGDQTCLHNARSPWLQCAMHPTDECSQCPDYKSIYFDHPQN